ncbi:MAG: 2-oxo acid dehydrogenase subunit E2, partial [Chitinophagaceae bacterium]
MAIVDLVMPKMGESIMEATVLKWLKQPGDTVQQDETVLEIATDKVDSEVPSTAEGTIDQILFNVNDVVPIGTVIATIRTVNQENSQLPKTTTLAPENDPPLVVIERTQTLSESTPGAASRNTGTSNQGKFYSPLVMNIASSEGISLTELEKIPGTGNEGRVTKKDVLEYLENRKNSDVHPTARTLHNQKPQVIQPHDEKISSNPLPTLYSGNVEILEMDRMRKMIAEHMVRSKHISPHVTSFSEADVTNLVMWRERVKKEFEKREGTKITFMPLLVESIVRSIKNYPLINSSLDGDNIMLKKYIKICMA